MWHVFCYHSQVNEYFVEKDKYFLTLSSYFKWLRNEPIPLKRTKALHPHWKSGQLAPAHSCPLLPLWGAFTRSPVFQNSLFIYHVTGWYEPIGCDSDLWGTVTVWTHVHMSHTCTGTNACKKKQAEAGPQACRLQPSGTLHPTGAFHKSEFTIESFLFLNCCNFPQLPPNIWLP